jgi:hypothetical protein
VSTCDVVDTADIQGAGTDTIGTGGFGVLGSSIPSSGTNGPGYTYNDLSLPADAGKEICGRITTWPSSGTLYAYEDTSFTFTGAADGSYTFQYQLYVDGASVGSPATVSLAVGDGSATAAGAACDGISSISPGAASGTSAGSAAGAALTGVSTISGGSASGTSSGSTSGATLTGTSAITSGSATGSSPGAVSGATLIGVSTIAAGLASGNVDSIVANPSQIYIAGSRMHFRPKRFSEVEVLTVDFAPLLAVGEVIISASWTITTLTGRDSNPGAMIRGSAYIGGTKVSQMIGAGVAGVRYAPVCLVQTSNGQTLALPEFSYGVLEVTL